AKKITIQGYVNEKKAIKLKSKLAKDYYIKTVSKDYDLKLDIEYRKKAFYVVLKPFHNQTLLLVVLKKIRINYPKAYINRFTDNSPTARPYVQGPMPKKKEVKIEKKSHPPKEIIKEKALHVKKVKEDDYSQYLRDNQENKKTDTWIGKSIGVFVLILFLMLIFWKFFYKKRNFSDSKGILLGERIKKRKNHVSKPEHSYEAIRVDLHSHLIPGIDDGAQNVSESIELVRALKNLGYTKLITTPHTMLQRYPNTSQSILEGFDILKDALLKENIDIDIEVASEYYLDEHLMDLLEKRDVLTFGDNYLLFEMSYINHPVNYEEMIQKMIDYGYKPVLAHPERYLYLGRNFDKYISLRILGVYLQLNINSIAGYYSAEVQQNARRLIDEGMVSFLGSDTHRLRHCETLETVLFSYEYQEIMKKNIILNNTLL
ncbi:MAG: CpsB/CapC family capsule biosynthesis tyrosine phosphatase, partial [Campylobacterota bacterium]|nr:CpsB/CapC family capsule biosynthesis tyrosine phosphatase [Campylobacterota bacterium]